MEKPRFLASNWCSAMPHRRGSWIPRCAPRQYPWVSIAEEKQTMLLRKSWSLNFSAVARLALPRNRYQNSIPKTLIDKNRTLAWNERRGSGYSGRSTIGNTECQVPSMNLLRNLRVVATTLLKNWAAEQKRPVCLAKYWSRFFPVKYRAKPIKNTRIATVYSISIKGFFHFLDLRPYFQDPFQIRPLFWGFWRNLLSTSSIMYHLAFRSGHSFGDFEETCSLLHRSCTT